MNGVSLFSGAGIGELALKQILPNYRTVGYVEWDNYCQEVIRARIRDGILDDAPIFGDIREFNAEYAEGYAGKVDWLSGGFPCQPFSVAGRQLGEADERNMWPAMRDAVSIIRPRYALLENVPGLLAHEYTRRIFGELAEDGYDCEWDVVGASDVGAPHRRKRVWILAYSRDVADTREPRLEGQRRSLGKQATYTIDGEHGWWETEPDVGRVANGVASRVDRFKALGNGWVPQVVKRLLQVD